MDFVGDVDFDPFSRYLPFRIEGELDKAILESYVEENTVGPPPPKKKKKSGKTLPQDTQSAISPSTMVLHRDLSTASELDASPLIPSSLSLLAVSNNPGRSGVTHLPPIPIYIWRTVLAGASSVNVHEAVIHSPIVRPHVLDENVSAFSIFNNLLSTVALTQDRVTMYDPPPEGFTLEGDIDLFGIKDLNAKLYVWSGAIPPEVTVITNPPIYDKALLTGDFKLSSVLPILNSTPFASITLRDVIFTYQNCVFDPTKAIGWHVDGNFVIEPSCGALYDILRTVLNVQEPIVHVHAGLGLKQGWGKPLSVSSFIFDGLLPGIQLNICDGFTLTSIGIELLGIHRMERVPKPHSVINYGFALFGSFNIDLPGSVTPLELDYRIFEIGGYVHLSSDLGGEDWIEPLGIRGLRVCLFFYPPVVPAGLLYT
jgi:hypothetical protein